MCPLTKFLVSLLLICHLVQESPGQLSHPRLFGDNSNLKNLLRLPDIKFHLPQRIIPDIREFKPLQRFNLPGFMSNKNNKETTTSTKTIVELTTTTFVPQIIKKHGEFEVDKADCSKLADLNCDDQRELIKNVFGDFKNNFSSDHAAGIAQSGTGTDVNDTTTIETTTDDDGISERFHDPALVATMLGR